MDYKSKTQKKKEADSLQELGENLVKLSKEQLEDIELPSEIYDAVRFAKTIKSHGARRRQMQYIGTLMRNIDPEPVQEAIENIEQGDYRKAAAFKEIETWRDQLIDGNKKLMEEILGKCPDADRQQLTQLVRNAIKERENNKPPGASRALFRYLTKARNR
jgi:ribosome-associated protein